MLENWIFVKFISKEQQNRMVKLIRVHKQNICALPYNYNNTTQDKKKALKALIDEGKGT